MYFYKTRMLLQADNLTELFEVCRGLEFGRGQKYIKIEKVYGRFLDNILFILLFVAINWFFYQLN